MKYIRIFYRYKDLYIQLFLREIGTVYKGSVIGILWALISPLIMLAIYSVAFGFFIKSAWPNSKENFTLTLFSGLMIYNFFSECMNRAPDLVVTNANYVKKVVFPIEIMGYVLIGSALFHMLLSLLAWILLAVVINQPIKLTFLWLPFIIFPFCLLLLGIIWIVSTLGVYLRDISQIVTMLTQGLIFLSPVFFPIENLPPLIKDIILLNPPSFIILQARRVMLEGLPPDFMGLFIYYVLGLVLCVFGYHFIRKLKSGFSDVL